MPKPSLRGRGLVALTVMLVGIFAVTIVLREPWRGHLAKGDQWVTALALRWVRAWHRDGAWASKLALVESPPTAEFAGERQVFKWGLPGQMLLLHVIAEPLGIDPDVAFLNRVALGTHLVLALVLAGVALLLARRTWPDRPRWDLLVAFHCGAFTLLFPPILYWGQNITAQDFMVMPLLAFIVTARWLRASVLSRRRRALLDVGVAVAVFLGTITEYLFLVVVPYFVLERLVAMRRERPRTTDPWLLTLVLPFALAMGCLAVVFVANGQLDLLRWRLNSWTTGGAGQSSASFVGVRVFLFLMFLKGHYADSFGLIGALALVLAFWKLVPRNRVAGLAPAARGILLDLLFPCLLFTLLLAHHQAFHTISAIKYVPYVALCWTFLVPLLLMQARRRTMLLSAYAVVAVLAILPFSSNYRRFFPDPEPQWDAEAAFLRDGTRPTDTVVSSVTQIDLVPPQRIALAERRVTHVYGPLDLLEHTTALGDDAIVALYGPCGVHRAFGIADAEIVERDGACIARFPLRSLRAIGRRDTGFRAQLGDALTSGLRGEPVRRPAAAISAPPPPLAIHVTDAQRLRLGEWDRLYWRDDRHAHWRAALGRGLTRELVILDDARYGTDWMTLWRQVPSFDQSPFALEEFVVGLFARAGALETTTFPWRGFDVVALPPVPTIAVLRPHAPSVNEWTPYLVLDAGIPVGVVLEPVTGGAPRVGIVFDRMAVDVTVPDYVSGEWTVQHD